MSFTRQQNSSNIHPIHPIIAHGLVGGALENDVPITRPIVVALVISSLIFVLFLGCSFWALLSRKGVTRSKRSPILDLEEHSLTDDRLLQSAFIKSCFDTYPRRSGLSSPRLGFSESLLDTPTTTATRFRFSSHLGSPQDNITLPPPAYSSRAHSLASRQYPSIFFLGSLPPSTATLQHTRRSFFSIAKEKKPPVSAPPPPPIISHPIPLPEPPLPGPPIEHEYAAKPMIQLIPELTPMSPLQVPVISQVDVDASGVFLISQTKPGGKREHISHNTSNCRCACHGPPSACRSCRPTCPRPIYIPASSAGSFLRCLNQGPLDVSSLTLSKI